MQALLAEADEDRPLSVMLDDTSWSSYGQFRNLLEVAARHLAAVGGLEGIADYESVHRTTAPDSASIRQSFDSPAEMVMATGNAGAGLYSIVAIDPEMVGRSHLRWRRQMLGGYQPFPELCSFFAGISPQMVRLFGWRDVEVEEISCQCRGDEQCIMDLRWDETDDREAQLNMVRTRLELADSRLQAFHDTVSDIVSAEDLDIVLRRIVRNAARSLYATGFVLSVDASVAGSGLYTDGVSIDEARRLLIDDATCVSAEIASKHRRYGRILAVGASDFGDLESGSLDAYARLAATALDSAFALAEARRQAGTARALLDLSTSLAELSSAVELTAKVAKAIPAVVDCDCSLVLLVTDGVARVSAVHGFSPEEAEQLDGVAIPIEDGSMAFVDRRRRTGDDFTNDFATIMGLSGIQAVATAPLVVDGRLVGGLVAAERAGSSRVLVEAMLLERFSGLAAQATVALRNGLLLDQIRHSSLHDSLTDLPNRLLLMDRAEQMLAQARADGTSPTVLFLDLDGFKEVNDTLGHGAGDELLQTVASRLQAAVRGGDTVGRLGGDEFVVLSKGDQFHRGADLLARRLLHALHEPIKLRGHECPVVVGASIGVAVGERPTADQLLQDADVALYRAKAGGKGRYCIFAPEIQGEVRSRAELALSVNRSSTAP